MLVEGTRCLEMLICLPMDHAQGQCIAFCIDKCMDMCIDMCTDAGDEIEAGAAGTAGIDRERMVSATQTHAWSMLDAWIEEGASQVEVLGDHAQIAPAPASVASSDTCEELAFWLDQKGLGSIYGRGVFQDTLVLQEELFKLVDSPKEVEELTKEDTSHLLKVLGDKGIKKAKLNKIANVLTSTSTTSRAASASMA